jgi:predicted Zn-dependent protease
MLMCAATPAPSLENAERALAVGDRAAAMAIVQPLAKRDNPRAIALLGRLHDLKGERAEAEKAYRRLIDLYNEDKIRDDDGPGMWAVAEAARGLGAYRDANDAFARAVKAAPDNLDIELAWVDLFLEKYDTQNAGVGLARVLEAQPDHARALERMARVRMEQGADFTSVEEMLDKALKSDPKLVAAHVTRAAIALHDEDLTKADRHLDAALAINPRDLEALSVRAAVRFVADDKDGFAKAIERVLAENPRFSRVYSIVGTYAEWEHRYEEQVALGDRALAIDPDDPYAHAMRALNMLRVGREKEGLVALEAAFRRDRYNVHVYNTLNLYDDVISKEYESIESAPFLLRMHKEERPHLEPYLAAMLKKAYPDLKSRYGFSPEGPISIELFASPEHFAVRTVGLPHIGVQGVCFGKVLTALSPRGGEFNWGQIVWHELSHVFHVQLSKSRVPRWFTEGLAEYETTRARPEWKREDDRILFDALTKNKVPRLANLNHAFTHARSGDELMVAYYASSVAVTYLIEKYGFQVVPKMLALWAKGTPTERVFTEALGVNLDTLDREFRAATQARLAARYAKDFRVDPADFRDADALSRAASQPNATPEARAKLAMAQAVAGSKEAEATAKAVLAVAPKEPLAHFALVHLALVSGELPRAKQRLDALFAAGVEGYQLRMLAARAEERLGHIGEAFAHLDAAIRLDADRGEAFELMVQLADKNKDEARLLQGLMRFSFLDQHARAPLARLLGMLEARGDWAELGKRAEAGLYLDPESSALHRQLALAYLHTRGPQDALPEAQRALALAQSDDEKTRAEAALAAVKGKPAKPAKK